MPIFVCAAPQVRWEQSPSDPFRATVEVTDLPSSVRDWSQYLSVYADQGDPISDTRLPSMLGTITLNAGALRFEPMFALQPGVTYRAILRPPGAAPIVSVLKVPKRDAKSKNEVVHIYPTATLVPENLLKFYVQFSAPMSRGGIYEHIELRDEKGRPVELPFLEIDEELWDDRMMRLTLFIDPGRIKRGVQPLEEVGPALEEGKKFTLTIRKSWPDAAGAPLKQDYTKSFKVGPPDREPPDPKTWKLSTPKPHTTDPLRVRFTESMDYALATRMISVARQGQRLSPEKALRDSERELVMTPADRWIPGDYELLVQNTIEDLAGNNIGKPFEVDLFEGVQRRITNSVVRVRFEIR